MRLFKEKGVTNLSGDLVIGFILDLCFFLLILDIQYHQYQLNLAFFFDTRYPVSSILFLNGPILFLNFRTTIINNYLMLNKIQKTK
jgi:hypothetical protein